MHQPFHRRIKSPENIFSDIMVYDIDCRVFPLRNIICCQSMYMHPAYILVMQTIFPKKYLKRNLFLIIFIKVMNC